MSKDKLSLEQALQSYRVMHTPTRLSWKQHWVNETFSNSNIMKCPEDEKKQLEDIYSPVLEQQLIEQSFSSVKTSQFNSLIFFTIINFLKQIFSILHYHRE